MRKTLAPRRHRSPRDLSGISLIGAKLIGTNLSSANLSNARRTGANVAGALWKETDLSGAISDNHMPKKYVQAEGQLVPTNQNAALLSLLGAPGGLHSQEVKAGKCDFAHVRSYS